MADAIVKLVNNRPVVKVSGSELLTPLVVSAQAARDAVRPLFGEGPPDEASGIAGSFYRDVSNPYAPLEWFKTEAGWQGPQALKGDPGGTSDLIGTRTEAQSMTIGPEFAAVRTTGYSAPGDGGGALYKRVASAPAHSAKFQSAGGQWWELAESSVTPEMFGAKGDDVIDDTNAVQRAIDFLSTRPLGRSLLLLTNRYFTPGGVTLKPYVSLRVLTPGAGFRFANAAINGLTVAGGTTQTRREISGLSLYGVCKRAFVCANSPAQFAGGLNLDVTNIHIGATCIDGMYLANIYCSNFRNITVSGDISNACIWLGATVNGVHFDNIYTSGAAHLYSLYIGNEQQPEGVTGLPPGHGITFTNPVLQGGKYGVFVYEGRAIVFNNIYTENVANPVVIGSRPTAVVARGVILNGGTYGGAYTYNPYYADRGPLFRVVGAQSVQINCPEAYLSADARPVTVAGGGGTGAGVEMLVNKDGSPAAYVISRPGAGYTSAPSLTPPPPISGDADTLVAVRDAENRLVRVDVIASGNATYLPKTSAYPVAALMGTRSQVTFTSPFTGQVSGAPFHTYVGIDDTAVGSVGVTILGDDDLEGATVEVRKTSGYLNMIAVETKDINGKAVVFTRRLPVIQAP